MAVNDPTYGVPTPTGVLQGVAAFGWDGTTWQPSGRAAAGVGTPTGVLRGVAPFTWSGSAWTPAGGGPDVATPSGVLDGVAVYTWSGSAWVPAGGPDTATPTGVLRGVAAFNWDGTAWQPSGQAGPDVATPTGVLQGVALFNWSGASWAPVTTTTLPTVDLVFLNTATLDPRITFTRGSVATYFDATGTMQTVAGNTPRFDYDPVTHASRGLLMEGAATNALVNSATLGTQSLAVTAQQYTLSFYGTGTITMSGTFAGSLVGAGPFPARVSTSFTPTAGTLTLTVTGSVLNAQLEGGGFVSSYIPTAGAGVTRQLDTAVMATSPWFNAAAGSLMAWFSDESWPSGGTYNAGPWAFDDGAGTRANTIDMIAFNNAATFMQPNLAIRTAGAGVSAISYTNINLATQPLVKIATAWNATTSAVATNGGATQTAAVTGALPAISRLSIGFGYAGINSVSGHMRRVSYWPRMLTNAELQQVST